MVKYSERNQKWLWLLPLLYLVIIALYSFIRYGGNWADTDSSTLARAIRPVIEQGKITPADNKDIYPNGFAYQSITAFLVNITGVDVATFQQVIYLLIAPLIVLPIWLLFNEILGDLRAAMFSTMLLLLQPEFLFVILRGSHEKFTRTLLVLCLYFLVRSLKVIGQPRPLAIYVLLFYLSAFAMATYNNFLSSSFVLSVTLSLGFGLLLGLSRKPLRQASFAVLPRLSYASLICVVLVFVSLFYVYEPAQIVLGTLKNGVQKVAALFLDVQTATDYTNAYANINIGWISLPVYLLLSSASFLAILFSIIIWFRQGWGWLVKGKPITNQNEWLLWLFYTAFATQSFFSIGFDRIGLIGNLQNRILPSFTMFAIIMIGFQLVRWRTRPIRAFWRYLAIPLVLCLAIFAPLKASNEPFLSNKWVFYSSAELAALNWADNNLTNTYIWSDFDERLSTAFEVNYNSSKNRNTFDIYDPKAATRTFFISDTTRLRSLRMQQPLPVPADANQLYDNGFGQLYRLRPLTPYQE